MTGPAQTARHCTFMDVYSTNALILRCGRLPILRKAVFAGTYVAQSHTSRGHAEYYECYLCHYTKYLGSYVYKKSWLWFLWFMDLAPPAAAIRGCWITKVTRPAHATVIGSIAVIAGSPSVKQSTQPVTITVTALGNSIRPASTGRELPRVLRRNRLRLCFAQLQLWKLEQRGQQPA